MLVLSLWKNFFIERLFLISVTYCITFYMFLADCDQKGSSSIGSIRCEFFWGFCTKEQEAFEKCWTHSPLRAAARPFTRCRYRYCRTPPAHRCPRRQRQRQRVTQGTAMAPWNGPNDLESWSRGIWCRRMSVQPQNIAALRSILVPVPRGIGG